MAVSFLLLRLMLLFTALLTGADEYYITILTNDTDIVAGSDSAFVDLVCPSSHPIWFVPHSSIGFQLNSENRLRVDLTEKNKPFQRGFYTCCPRARALSPNDAVQNVRTPTCCPCCSWPEEEYCSAISWNTSSSLEAPPCMQIFLFTGMVPCRETTLTLPWRSRVLIPCPAPLPTSNLQIYSQLPKIRPSRRLWFRGSATDAGIFNPRFGVCTTQQRIPGGHMQLSCEYPTTKCVVKPQAPFAPPTILPNVTCKLFPTWREFALNSKTSLEIRVIGPLNLSVTCTALYDNIFIANRPPTLCFRWRTTIASSQRHTPTWSRHECVRTEQIEDTVTVAATNAYSFTSEGPFTRVDVEIVERNRATAVQNFSMRLHVSQPSEKNKMFVEVDRSINSTFYSLFSDNSTSNQTLVIFDTSLSHLTLGFYSLDEVTPNTSCTSPTLEKEYFNLNRTSDRWLCTVTLPKFPFSVSLRQGNLESWVTIYPSPDALLPHSTVAGLRGSVDVYINVTCPLIERDSPHLFNTTPSHIQWLVHRGDDLFIETRTNKSWLLIAPLINSTAVSMEPVLERSSPSPSSLGEFLVNLSTLSLPPVVDFSRVLCVSCETFFFFGSSSKSTRECVTLEAKDEPREENLSPVETALRRFSSVFTPIQVSNASNPSFRITTAFPSSDLKMDGAIPRISVYSGSMLELRCSRSRTSDSTSWPLIVFDGYDGKPSLPEGILELYALPFTLESRLRINASMVKTAAEGSYLCGSVYANSTPLLVDVVPSKAPEVVEPNQPVRYFTANELIRLTCRAVGVPAPIIVWRHVNQTQTGNTTVLKWCNESHLKEESTCSLVYVPLPRAENVTIECEAINYLGNAVYTLNVIRISANNELAGNILFGRMWKSYVFWIIVPLVVIFCFLICLGSCLWRKSRQMVKAEKLINMDNLIYGRPNKLAADIRDSDLDPFYQEILCSLMPTEELRDRWCLNRRHLRPFSQPLGNGHYGTVQKAIYYGLRNKGKKHEDPFFVALKSPSAEIASLSCFRNEIAHLMKLSDGPNIVKMIGCAFGEKCDLRDTLLVLEFCPNTSLSDFIRRMLYSRGYYDDRPMYVRNTEGGISTGSTQVSTTPTPSSDTSISQFAWNAHQYPATRVIGNDYDKEHEIQEKRRRRGATSVRRNTALVYQRLTHNSSSIFLRIAMGISRGLEFLAQNNVIHRDLATRNILMDGKYEPKICDFGLAVTVDPLQDYSDGKARQPSAGCYHIITFTKQLPFRILPPEALSKQLFYLTSDIWEFGLLLWQMFFFETRKPFEGVQSSDALLHFLSSGRQQPSRFLNYVIPGASDSNTSQAPPTIDRPPAIPDALWEVICDCLCFQASERPSASEVYRRLVDCYTMYEEMSVDGVKCERGNSYHMLCRSVSSQEDIQRSNSFMQEVLDECLATYENIEQTGNGALKNFPSSSV